MEDAGICQSLGCGKPAKQVCPKCLQSKIPSSQAGFCSQECFKSSWSTHKLNAHPEPSADSNSTIPKVFAGFQFTGKIRPGVVSPRRTVPDHIVKPDYAASGEPLLERSLRKDLSIPVNTPKQIEALRNLGKLGREVLDLAGQYAKPGVRTDEIDKIVHEACIERGAYPSPLNYKGFPKSVCTSVNEIVCHGIPDSRKLEDGDIVNIDVSLYKDGVHIDLNDTFLVGNVDENGRKLVQATKEALDKAIEIVKPGTQYREVGNVISKHVQKQGFSVVVTYCGHGVGELFHANPSIPHYAKNKAVGVMKAGHVFTIEPMINEGTYVDILWPDDWTSSTKDGKRSAQFEHTILVTETGHEVLTARIAKE